MFPEPWRLQQQICLSFCAVTKQQLGEILENKARPCRFMCYELYAVRISSQEPALILHCKMCADHRCSPRCGVQLEPSDEDPGSVAAALLQCTLHRWRFLNYCTDSSRPSGEDAWQVILIRIMTGVAEHAGGGAAGPGGGAAARRERHQRLRGGHGGALWRRDWRRLGGGARAMKFIAEPVASRQ